MCTWASYLPLLLQTCTALEAVHKVHVMAVSVQGHNWTIRIHGQFDILYLNVISYMLCETG